jgi:hypothetical protein
VLNSVAPLATILNDVPTFSVGGAFLKLHCLFASDADQETYEWTFIVVQMMPPGHSHRRETWKPLLLKKLPLTTYLLLRGPRQRLRFLGGDSETNRALGLFPLRLQPELYGLPFVLGGGPSERSRVQFGRVGIAPQRGANECPRLAGGDQTEESLVLF